MDRINLTLDILPNEIGQKTVNVRGSLRIANLIADIQDRFNLDGTLELHPEGVDTPLGLNQALEQAGIEEGSVLICDRVMEDTGTANAIEAGVRQPLEGGFKRVYLTEQRTLTEFELDWQPAIVGRKDVRNPSNNRLLAVDLEPVEDLPTVSRHHACITLSEGSFFIETVQPRNPTFLDDTRLKEGIKYPLAAGSIVQVAGVALTFNVLG